MVHAPYSCCHKWLISLFTAFKVHIIIVVILVTVRLRFRLCQFNISGYDDGWGWGGTRWRIWLRHCATCRKVGIQIASLEFFMDIIFSAPQWPRVNSTSNRNEYQKCYLVFKSRCVWMIPLHLSCADCRDVWEPKTPGILRFSPGLYRDCITAITSGRSLAGNAGSNPAGGMAVSFLWVLCVMK
jgi:hypothetical protein